MKQVYDKIYVGTVEDAKIADCLGMALLGACKEPLHRRYAKLQDSDTYGYIGRAMPKDEKEYLYAERENALYCNLIDTPNVEFISDEIIDKCMEFIDNKVAKGKSVLIVCNQAESRSPSIALMWLMKEGHFDKNMSYSEVVFEFRKKYYENYNPGRGFLDYTNKFWEEYKNGQY